MRKTDIYRETFHLNWEKKSWASSGEKVMKNEFFHKSRGALCNARFELFYLFNYLIEFRVFLNNLFDLW